MSDMCATKYSALFADSIDTLSQIVQDSALRLLWEAPTALLPYTALFHHEIDFCFRLLCRRARAIIIDERQMVSYGKSDIDLW